MWDLQDILIFFFRSDLDTDAMDLIMLIWIFILKHSPISNATSFLLPFRAESCAECRNVWWAGVCGCRRRSPFGVHVKLKVMSGADMWYSATAFSLLKPAICSIIHTHCSKLLQRSSYRGRRLAAHTWHAHTLTIVHNSVQIFTVFLISNLLF